jgi:NADH-quinone oxidoreductase subunit M
VTNPANEKLPDMNAREAWQFAPLIFLIFWIGIYPKPVLSYINPQTEMVVAQVQPDYFQNAPAAQRPRLAEERQNDRSQPLEQQPATAEPER